MVNSTSLVHHNNRFHFSFDSKASHTHSHSLHKNLPFSVSLSSSSSSFPPPSSSSSSLCCRVARVPIEALELSPPTPEFNFYHEIARLKALRSKLDGCKTMKEKLKVIDRDSRVGEFFRSHRNSGLSRVLASFNLTSNDLFLLKCLIAAGQEHVLSMGFYSGHTEMESATSSVKSALYALAEMIENLDVYNGNGSSGLGKMDMALEDEEIRDLKKLLQTLGEIERFYDCIGGIIG